MRTRPVIAILEDHYRRILGEIQAFESDTDAGGVTPSEPASSVQGQHDLLRAIETCLRLVEPAWTKAHLRPKKRRRPPELPYRALIHMAYDVLRPSTRFMTTAEIMQGLRQAGKLTEEQARSLKLRSALTSNLRGEAGRGAVEMRGPPRGLEWRVIRRAEDRPAA